MKRRQIIIDIALAGLFCTLLCIGAYIKIPIFTIPMSLQVFFALLSGLVLSVRANFLANFTYIALGFIGLPIFASGGGIGYIIMPTFGFVLGFLISSVIVSIIVKKTQIKSFKSNFALCLLAIVIIYVIGVPYFALMTNADAPIFYIIETLFLPFIVKDIICAILASLIAFKIRPMLTKLSN